MKGLITFYMRRTPTDNDKAFILTTPSDLNSRQLDYSTWTSGNLTAFEVRDWVTYITLIITNKYHRMVVNGKPIMFNSESKLIGG